MLGDPKAIVKYTLLKKNFALFIKLPAVSILDFIISFNPVSEKSSVEFSAALEVCS